MSDNWTEKEEQAMRDSYVEYNVPADQISASNSHLNNFFTLFGKKAGKHKHTREAVITKLIAMRKRGHGVLPTLRR